MSALPSSPVPSSPAPSSPETSSAPSPAPSSKVTSFPAPSSPETSSPAPSSAAPISASEAAETKKLLKMVELSPTHSLTYKYYGKITYEHKAELTVYNPTERIVAFKLKGTSPKIIKMCPGYGYLKPQGRVTIWVIVDPLPNGKPPVKEHIAVLIAIAPPDHPPNPHHFWLDKNLIKTPRRKTVLLKFVEEKAPLFVSKFPTKSLVYKIQKKKDDDESSGSEESEKDTGSIKDDD